MVAEMMLKTTTITCLLLFAVVLVRGASECDHRNYGLGSTVCVCSDRHCDDLEPVKPTAKGTVTVITTSKAGRRFARNETHFGKLGHGPLQPVTIAIDASKHYQKIIGFGGAFTDAAGLNIAKLGAKLQKRLIEDYFGRQGAEYNLGRITIGGSDFSSRPYSYVDHPKDESLGTFALQEEDYKYKIPYLKMAAEVNPGVKYFGSTWSPPAWMKTNKKLDGNGALIGEPGGKYYKLFAEYKLRFLKEYQKHNISLWGLTVVNEPGEHGFNSLVMTGAQQRDYLKKDLGPLLKSNGFGLDKLKLMIFDYALDRLLDFVRPILADHEAAQYVSGVAYHWYWNNNSPDRKELEAIAKEYPQYWHLATEACEEWHGKSNHVQLGSWETFNKYADDIIKDLNHHTTGWVDWNLALDVHGGPNWVSNFVDAPIIVNATANEYYKQPMYYALAHFSKLLAENSVRIEHQVKISAHEDIQVVAFRRPDNGTVTTVLNRGAKATTVEIDEPSQGKLVAHLEPESLTSFVWYS